MTYHNKNINEAVISNPVSPEEYEEEERHSLHCIRCGPFLCIIYTLLGSLCVTFSSITVKKMNYITTEQLTLVRNGGYLVWALPIVMFRGLQLFGTKTVRLHLFIACFLGATAIYFNHLAYRLLPVAEATIIISTNPAIVMIGARLLLKEPCGLISSSALILTFVGVLLSVRIPELLKNRTNSYFTPEYLTGVAFAVACTCCRAGSFLATRKIKHVHVSLVLIHIGTIGVIENIGLTSIIGSFELPHCGPDSLLMLSVALFGFVGHCFMILAIQSEAVGIVSVMKCSLDIAVGILFQVVFFSDVLDVYNLCGAIVVVLAVSAIGFRKWLMQLPCQSNVRRRLRFMLL